MLLVSALAPVNPQSTVTVASGALGNSDITWFVTAQIGTYALTAQGPTGLRRASLGDADLYRELGRELGAT